MASTVTAPQTLLAGSSPLQLTSPQGGGGAGTQFAIVIYNQTPYLLRVVGASGASYLLPLTADKFTGPGVAQGQVFVVALNATAPTGTALGTVQATWGAAPDDISSDYPQPLPPFPGAGFELTTNSGLVPAVAGVFEVAVPFGTQALVFADSLQGGGGIVQSVVGVQSGVNYAPATLSVPAGGTASLSVTNPITTDTLFKITMAGGFNCVIYAAQVGGLIVPAFASLTTDNVDISSGAATLLAAPSVGANYIFGWSWVLDTGATRALVELRAGGKTIDYSVFNTTPDSQNRHLDLERTTGAVTIATIAGGPVGVTNLAVLRYAFGP